MQAEVGRWLAAAAAAAGNLRGAIKDAWFDADARGDFGHIDSAYWDATEPAFYRQLQAVIEATRQGTEPPPLPTREAWHRMLVATALRLFDERFVGAGPVEQQNPRRAALARKQLRRNLHGPKLRAALGLRVDEPPPKAGRKTRKTKEAA